MDIFTTTVEAIRHFSVERLKIILLREVVVFLIKPLVCLLKRNEQASGELKENVVNNDVFMRGEAVTRQLAIKDVLSKRGKGRQGFSSNSLIQGEVSETHCQTGVVNLR